MEKIMISIAKGRGETTLNKASSEKANKMSHHHLNIFVMGISFFSLRFTEERFLQARSAAPGAAWAAFPSIFNLLEA